MLCCLKVALVAIPCSGEPTLFETAKVTVFDTSELFRTQVGNSLRRFNNIIAIYFLIFLRGVDDIYLFIQACINIYIGIIVWTKSVFESRTINIQANCPICTSCLNENTLHSFSFAFSFLRFERQASTIFYLYMDVRHAFFFFARAHNSIRAHNLIIFCRQYSIASSVRTAKSCAGDLGMEKAPNIAAGYLRAQVSCRRLLYTNQIIKWYALHHLAFLPYVYKNR